MLKGFKDILFAKEINCIDIKNTPLLDDVTVI